MPRAAPFLPFTYLPGLRPTVVLMNPPFSASPGVDRIRHDADLRHIRSAFSMLPPGGRLVAIASAHCVPGDTAWVDAFASLVPPARVAFTTAIDGRAYARRGTTFDTRLTVLDRGGDERGRSDVHTRVEGAAQLLEAVATQMPTRLPIEPLPGADLFGHAPTPRPTPGRRARTAAHGPQPSSHNWGTVAELAYEAGRATSDSNGPAQASGPYELWRSCTVRVPGAVEHPTPLVQSGAMAAVLMMLRAPQGVWGLIAERFDLRFFPVQRRLVFDPASFSFVADAQQEGTRKP